LNSVHIHIFRYADLLLLLAEAAVETNNLEEARGIVNQIRARAGQTAEGCGSAALTQTKYPSCAGHDEIALPLIHVTPTKDSLLTPWAVYKIGQYTTPWTDQAFARRAVWYERRLELAMEGQRFFDLRRWAAADSVIPNYLAVEKTRLSWMATAAQFESRHHLYPIPQIQIELSHGALCQNNGWGTPACP